MDREGYTMDREGYTMDRRYLAVELVVPKLSYSAWNKRVKQTQKKGEAKVHACMHCEL
jgi:hypothetical protein